MKHVILTFMILLAGTLRCYAGDDAVVVTEGDNGGTASVASGGTLILKVQAGRGTSFSWRLQNDVSPQLALINQSNQAVTPGRLGGPQNTVFTFRAGESGVTTLSASLLSDVEENSDPRTVSITVTVTN